VGIPLAEGVVLQKVEVELTDTGDVEVAVGLEGNVAEFNEDKQTAFLQAIADSLGITLLRCIIRSINAGADHRRAGILAVNVVVEVLNRITEAPTLSPTEAPLFPTKAPLSPTKSPLPPGSPTQAPVTRPPSAPPSISPTTSPEEPTDPPTSAPTVYTQPPTNYPTSRPTDTPTSTPTVPTAAPTTRPVTAVVVAQSVERLAGTPVSSGSGATHSIISGTAVTAADGDVQVSVTLSGDVSTFDGIARQAVIYAVATDLSIDPTRITIVQVTPGSVIFTFRILNPNKVYVPPLVTLKLGGDDGVEAWIIIVPVLLGVMFIVAIILVVLYCRNARTQKTDNQPQTPSGQMTDEAAPPPDGAEAPPKDMQGLPYGDEDLN